MTEAVIVAVGGLVVAWIGLLVILWRLAPSQVTLREALRLMPDLLHLIKRLATDRTLPRSAQALVWALIGYLALPFDLVPDLVPVIGYADDVIVLMLVLRFVARRAGADALRRHWPGTEDGLSALRGLLRL